MEEYKQAKAHWKVLHRDKNKVNIPGSKKPVVTKGNIKSKQPCTFHIPCPCHIPLALDEVEPKC